MSNLVHWAALAAYLLAIVVYLAFVISQRRPLHLVGEAVLWLGLGLHTAALVLAWGEMGAMPAASLRQSLDLFSWAVVAAALLVNLRLRVMMLGVVTAPVAVFFLLASALLPAAAPGPLPVFKNLVLILHVFAALLAYGLLALTCLGGLLYLVQDGLIRAKRLGAVYQRLPSLDRLDSLSRNSLLAGFVLMTVGMALGAIYAHMVLGSYWRWDPKEVWSLITWLLYAALIHTRLVSGWRGRRGAWLSVIAFGALLFTFIGVGLLMPGYHSFESYPLLPRPLP